MHIDATPTHIKSYFKKINRKAKTLYGKEKMVTQQKQMKTKLKGLSMLQKEYEKMDMVITNSIVGW